jgi:hypothetical protein
MGTVWIFSFFFSAVTTTVSMPAACAAVALHVATASMLAPVNRAVRRFDCRSIFNPLFLASGVRPVPIPSRASGALNL